MICTIGVFAMSEDFRIPRLTSELVDLRMGNANVVIQSLPLVASSAKITLVVLL